MPYVLWPFRPCRRSRLDGASIIRVKLEQMRSQAVRPVQAGKRPASAARDVSLYAKRLGIRLAAYRSAQSRALHTRNAMGRPKRLRARPI